MADTEIVSAAAGPAAQAAHPSARSPEGSHGAPAVSESPPAAADSSTALAADANESQALSILPEIGPLALSFASAGGFAPDKVSSASGWLETYLQQGVSPDEKRTHGYNFSGIDWLSDKDRPALHNFGNWAAKQGWDQESVDQAIRWYGNLSSGKPAAAAPFQGVDNAHLRDRNETESAMRSEWGHEYRENIRAINAYLDNLPADQRQAIEEGINHADGRLLLNTPAKLRELAALARGGKAPPTDKAVVTSEIARLEGLMRTNRKAYEKESSYYRSLLIQRDGA